MFRLTIAATRDRNAKTQREDRGHAALQVVQRAVAQAVDRTAAGVVRLMQAVAAAPDCPAVPAAETRT